jgi:O-methyltransferase
VGRRRGPALVDALAAAVYRMGPGRSPDLVLKRLGIATSRRRLEFWTLETLLCEMPRLDGAIVECGTYRGGTLLGMAHILNRRGMRARLFALDSFEGFPEPLPEDAQPGGTLHPDVHRGALGDTSYDELLRRITLLGWNDRITVIKGFFEDTLPTLRDERFSIAHLDCDLYASYKTCLEFLYPRMRSGGIMVLDDYRLPANVYPGCDRAVDEFFADKREKPERLPGPKGLRSFVRIG